MWISEIEIPRLNNNANIILEQTNKNKDVFFLKKKKCIYQLIHQSKNAQKG